MTKAAKVQGGNLEAFFADLAQGDQDQETQGAALENTAAPADLESFFNRLAAQVETGPGDLLSTPTGGAQKLSKGEPWGALGKAKQNAAKWANRITAQTVDAAQSGTPIQTALQLAIKGDGLTPDRMNALTNNLRGTLTPTYWDRVAPMVNVLALEAGIDSSIARLEAGHDKTLQTWATGKAQRIAQKLANGAKPESIFADEKMRMNGEQTRALILALAGVLSDSDYGRILSAGFGMPFNDSPNPQA